ncbi:MAG: PH domain-containing protein, partial [Sphingomonadaceae bacterium]|nr:PH domain-containing protein [Sphingomonadaceae bacterium]
MSEYDWEPVRGLPGRLPQGEHILWQGSPDWRSLARTVFHVRAITLYFTALLAFGIVSGSLIGALATAAAGALCLA